MCQPPKVKYRIHNGQLQAWDDDDALLWGQVWITICVHCHGGPLEPSKRIVCGECRGTDEPTKAHVCPDELEHRCPGCDGGARHPCRLPPSPFPPADRRCP